MERLLHFDLIHTCIRAGTCRQRRTGARWATWTRQWTPQSLCYENMHNAVVTMYHNQYHSSAIQDVAWVEFGLCPNYCLARWHFSTPPLSKSSWHSSYHYWVHFWSRRCPSLKYISSNSYTSCPYHSQRVILLPHDSSTQRLPKTRIIIGM